MLRPVAWPAFAHQEPGALGWPVSVPLPSLLLFSLPRCGELPHPPVSSWAWPLGGSPCPTTLPLTRSQEFCSLLLHSGGGEGSPLFLVLGCCTPKLLFEQCFHVSLSHLPLSPGLMEAPAEWGRGRGRLDSGTIVVIKLRRGVRCPGVPVTQRWAGLAVV